MNIGTILSRSFLRLKSHENNIFVLSLYTVFTIFLTYPVAFHIGSAIPGDGDSFQWMRTLWYTKAAIFNSEITTLTQDNLLFYPTGVPIGPFPSAFNQGVFLVLTPFLELDIIFSLLWLFSFIIGAFGTYLLVKYLTKNNYAAFVSGIVFAFTPYHMVHGLGHFGAATIEWIPFCALFLIKMFIEGNWKHSIYAGFFFILVAASDMQYMLFMGIFVGLLFLYEFYYHVLKEYVSHRSSISTNLFTFLKKYCIFGLISFPGVLLLSFHDILKATSSNNFLKLDFHETVIYSTDLLSFFLPAKMHPLFGTYVSPLFNNFLGNQTEHTTFIGFTVLALSIFVMITLRKDIVVRFWILSALFFSILSLGPILKIKGEMEFPLFNGTIPLPHLILYHLVPFLENCRTIGRFYIIAALAFAVLAGYGISKILEKRQESKVLISVLIISLISLEFLFIPYPVASSDIPDFYENLSSDQEYYAILGLPAANTNYLAQVDTVYFQTAHGKPLIGNHHARIPNSARDFEKNTPFIRELSSINPNILDITNQSVSQIGNSVLNHYNIRYVVLHEKYLDTNQTKVLTEMLDTTLKTSGTHYNNDKIIVYQVKEEPIIPFIALKNGWYNREFWQKSPGRWINKNASLAIITPEDKRYLLSFEVGSYTISRNLSITINDELIDTYTIPLNVPGDNTPMIIQRDINLSEGENVINFVVREKGSVPAEVSGSGDTRELTLAFQNITYTDFPLK